MDGTTNNPPSTPVTPNDPTSIQDKNPSAPNPTTPTPSAATPTPLNTMPPNPTSPNQMPPTPTPTAAPSPPPLSPTDMTQNSQQPNSQPVPQQNNPDITPPSETPSANTSTPPLATGESDPLLTDKVHPEDLDERWSSWKCLVCGYVYEGQKKINVCPRCGNDNPDKFDDPY